MDTKIKKSFSSALYDARTRLGISQENMAENCDISARQYSDLENAKRVPTLNTFLKAVIACDIDVNSFVLDIACKTENEGELL